MEQPDTSVSISLTVKDTASALDFYNRAFGAEETLRMPDPGGGIAHAEFNIGNTHLYISDESKEWSAYAMPEGQMASCLFSIAVDDCDQAHAKAIEAGAKSLAAPENQFWGMRTCVVLDPFGYRWSLGQITEKMTVEEVLQRAKELFGG
jgi:PhnB protein